MHTRRLATFLLAAWLAGSILLDFCVIQNFRSVDRFLASPDPLAAVQVHELGGKAPARQLIRHEVAQLNAFLFERWQDVELVLGVALLALFVFGRGEPPRIALLMTAFMLGIAAVMRFYLTPEINQLGALIDYPTAPGANAGLFWRLHAVSSGLELLKLALGLTAALALLVRWPDRGRFVREQERLARAAGRVNR